MTTTATVETLTAEVRVLTVGNRQVTVSVARQLDWFEVDDDEAQGFTPFGRVRTGDKSGERFEPCRQRDRGAQTMHGRWGRWVSSEWDFEWIGRASSGSLILVRMMRNGLTSGDDEWNRQIRSWQELPLIVLAGLR